MVNGVEKDSFRIGKMKFGLASYADLSWELSQLAAKEHPDRSSKLARLGIWREKPTAMFWSLVVGEKPVGEIPVAE